MSRIVRSMIHVLLTAEALRSSLGLKHLTNAVSVIQDESAVSWRNPVWAGFNGRLFDLPPRFCHLISPL